VDQPKAMEDFGYSMEKNILTATSLGLAPAGWEDIQQDRIWQKNESCGR